MIRQDKKDQLFFLLIDKPLRWKEIREKINIPEPTLHKYLKELIKDKLIEKKLNNKGNIIYSVNKDNIKKYNVEDRIRFLNDGLGNIEKFKRLGLFNKGINIADIVGFVQKEDDKKIAKFLKRWDEPRILTLLRFLEIVNSTPELFMKAKVSGRIKINENPETITKVLKEEIHKYEKLF